MQKYQKGIQIGIVNIPRDIEGVEMAIFLKEDNGSTKASIRAKNTAHHIDARNFSVMFGRRRS